MRKLFLVISLLLLPFLSLASSALADSGVNQSQICTDNPITQSTYSSRHVLLQQLTATVCISEKNVPGKGYSLVVDSSLQTFGPLSFCTFYTSIRLRDAFISNGALGVGKNIPCTNTGSYDPTKPYHTYTSEVILGRKPIKFLRFGNLGKVFQPYVTVRYTDSFSYERIMGLNAANNNVPSMIME